MKLLKQFAFACLIALTFSACSGDDDNNNEEASLIGTWKVSSVLFNGEPEPLDECDLMGTFVISETTITSTYYEGTNCEDSFTDVIPYTREGDMLIVPVDGIEFSLEITSLTNTTLVLTETEEGDVFVNTYTRQ